MYVLFEGIDGVGKSTQIEILAAKFKDIITTKEPGASELGGYLREILLNGKFSLSARAEALLFLADRAEHFNKIIKPNLKNLILSDRGFISGIAYALANDENADINELIALNKFALNNTLPDKIIILKASKNLVLKRLNSRENRDFIEARGLDYLMRVQENMLLIAKICAISTLIIDANKGVSEISSEIENFINLKNKGN